ncbi:MAG: PsbP-related protein [Candidatus Absconditabacterales bacterium]
MKKILSLLLVGGFIFLFGCAKNGTTDPTTIETTTTDTVINEQVTDERQTYESKKDAFSIQFPGTRTFQENVYGSSVMFSSPTNEEDKIRENVGIMKKPMSKEYTLEEYYALTKSELEAQADYAEVENTTITINGVEAKKIIFKSSMNNTKLQFEQVFLIKNKIAYIITYTATEDTFDQYIKKVNEMIITLEIK